MFPYSYANLSTPPAYTHHGYYIDPGVYGDFGHGWGTRSSWWRGSIPQYEYSFPGIQAVYEKSSDRTVVDQYGAAQCQYCAFCNVVHPSELFYPVGNQVEQDWRRQSFVASECAVYVPEVRSMSFERSRERMVGNEEQRRAYVRMVRAQRERARQLSEQHKGASRLSRWWSRRRGHGGPSYSLDGPWDTAAFAYVGNEAS